MSMKHNYVLAYTPVHLKLEVYGFKCSSARIHAYNLQENINVKIVTAKNSI